MLLFLLRPVVCVLREAGVRNLKKHLEKIYRKAAFKLVHQGAKLVAVERPAAPAADSSNSEKDNQADLATSSSSSSGQEPQEDLTSSSSSSGEQPQEDSSSSSSSNSEERSQEDSPTSSSSSNDQPPGVSDSSTDNVCEVQYDGDPVSVSDSDLKEYVGLPPFAQDKFYDTTPPGVVMGLAWTAMGGATLYVEAAAILDVSGIKSLEFRVLALGVGLDVFNSNPKPYLM